MSVWTLVGGWLVALVLFVPAWSLFIRWGRRGDG